MSLFFSNFARKAILKNIAILVFLFAANLSALYATNTYSFGVLPQRSPVLTAKAWNPILEYISSKTGKKLVMQVTRSGEESRAVIIKGGYDFVYSNHIFDPLAKNAHYSVIARPKTEDIAGQIVVAKDSKIQSVSELNNLSVGFPSRAAFVGYLVPIDYLKSNHINVKEVFGGNQEGIIAQLKSAQIQAAAVNSISMRSYAQREKFEFRVLWESPKYHALPISANPKVAKADIKQIQKAFVDMSNDTEGKKILAESSKIINEIEDGFVISNDADYSNYTNFFNKQK
jgi:phosphonate transport system substrate-binding protein